MKLAPGTLYSYDTCCRYPLYTYDTYCRYPLYLWHLLQVPFIYLTPAAISYILMTLAAGILYTAEGKTRSYSYTPPSC